MQGPATSANTISRIRDALNNARGFSCEILNYRKNETPFWNELTIIPRRDDSGRLTNFIGAIRGITLQITAEPSTVVLNEHVQVVLDRIQSGIVLHHATTEIIYANAAATALLGVERDNVTGATNSDPRWRFRRADDSPMPVDEYPASIAIRERNPLKNYIVGSLAAPHAWLASCGCSAMPRVDGRPNG